MEYDKIKQEIDKLEEVYSIKRKIFDKTWFKDESEFDSKDEYLKYYEIIVLKFEQYQSELDNFCQNELIKLKELEKEERLLRPLEFDNLPTYGHIMSLTDFVDAEFIDYDGFGKYVKDNKMSNIEIYPSDIKNNLLRTDFDTIIWFNR